MFAEKFSTCKNTKKSPMKFNADAFFCRNSCQNINAPTVKNQFSATCSALTNQRPAWVRYGSIRS